MVITYNAGTLITNWGQTGGADVWYVNGTSTSNVISNTALPATAGGDQLYASYLNMSGAGTSPLAFGAGNDTVTLDHTTAYNVNMGAGSNILTTTNSSFTTLTGLTNQDNFTITNTKVTTAVNTASGDDTVTLTDSTVGVVNLGVGNDTLYMYGGTATDILTGTAYPVDTDKITISNGATITGTINVNASEYVEMTVTDSTVMGSINRQLTTGYLTIKNSTIGTTGSNSDVIAMGNVNGAILTIDDSTINSTIYTYSFNDVINISNTKLTTTFATNAGNDTVNLTKVQLGTNGLDLGAGNDTVNVSNLTFSSTAQILGNTGSDSFTVNSALAQNFTVNGGTGMGGITGIEMDTLSVAVPLGFTASDIVYTSTNNENGYIEYTLNGVTRRLTFSEIEKIQLTTITDIPCFTKGTHILTDEGEKRVQNLSIGDRVQTATHGLQIIRWIGSRTVRAVGKFAPIQFKKGAINNKRQLLVSPCHRMLISDWRAEVLFNTREILVQAKDLVNDNTIIQKNLDEITYYHLMFDRHEIIYAENVPTESFFAGAYIRHQMDEEALNEIHEIFPELKNAQTDITPIARKVLLEHEVQVLQLNYH